MNGREEFDEGDAYALLDKVEDMCERISAMDRITPGVRASVILYRDEMPFRLTVEVLHEEGGGNG